MNAIDRATRDAAGLLGSWLLPNASPCEVAAVAFVAGRAAGEAARALGPRAFDLIVKLPAHDGPEVD